MGDMVTLSILMLAALDWWSWRKVGSSSVEHHDVHTGFTANSLDNTETTYKHLGFFTQDNRQITRSSNANFPAV